MIKFVLPTRGCVYLWLYPQCPLIVVWSENKLCLWLQTRNFNCLIKKFWLWSAIKEVKTSWNKCNIFFGIRAFPLPSCTTSIPWIRSWPKCAKVVFPIMCEGHSRQLLAHSRCATSTSGNKNRKKGASK